MHDTDLPDNLTIEQRANIYQDIISLKNEYAHHGKVTFEQAQIWQWIGKLEDLSVTELYDFWLGEVAEWLASRHDMPPQTDDGQTPEFDAWVDTQWNALLEEDSETDYGYVLPVEITTDYIEDVRSHGPDVPSHMA